MKIRDELRGKIKIVIGNGRSTSLWHDNWHAAGPLMEKYGNHIAYDSGLGANAKV